MTLSEGHTNMPLFPSLKIDITQTQVGLYLAKEFPKLFELLTASKNPTNYADDAEAITADELAARFTDQE